MAKKKVEKSLKDFASSVQSTVPDCQYCNYTSGKNIIILDKKSKSVVIENVKYIRYTIRNQGVCPDWHLGVGNPTWIFLDELIFD